MDISNKTLAILVVLAIIVSLVGLFIGRARIVTLGEASQVAGLVNVTVVSNVDIAVSGGVNFTQILTPGSAGQSSHLGGSVCNEAAGLCNITVGSIGTTIVDIEYYASTGGLFTVPPGASDYFNASVASIGYLPAPVDQVLSACATKQWPVDDTPPLGNGPYQNIPESSGNAQEIYRGCDQYEGFTMAIQIAVPAGEPSGLKTATLNFVASETT